MKITKNAIYIEVEINLTVKTENQSSYFDSFWFLMDCEVNKLKSKEIYIDDVKVDDSNFEIDVNNINIQYEKLFNGQFRKIKVIQEIQKEFTNYSFQNLILNKEDVLAKFLIYGEEGIKIDDITNKNYIFNKELNLAYFEGKTTSETVLGHGYINYSKIINFQIYKYISEFQKKEEEIIKIKNNNENNVIAVLAIYKNIIITDFGQEVDEIYKLILLNYEGGTISKTISHGLMIDKRFDVDLVELNGRKTEYTKENSSIKINNFGASNNQFAEIHMKYKYYTNEDKSILRQESIITSNTKKHIVI